MQDFRSGLANHLEQKIRLLTNSHVLVELMQGGGNLFVENNSSKISTLVQNLHLSNKVYIQTFLVIFIGGLADIALSLIAVGGYVSWYAALFVVVYGILVVAITMHGNKRAAENLQEAQSRANEGANLLGNIVANIISIRVFQAQNWVSRLYERFDQSAAQEWRSFYRLRNRYSAFQAILLFLQYGSIFGVLIWTREAAMPVAEMVMISMILLQLNRPFELIGVSLRDVALAKSMAAPLQAILDKHAAKPLDAKLHLPLSSSSKLEIQLDGLSFAYEPRRILLEKVSANFFPGRINFVIGPSGAGKSTLMRILLRFQDGYQGSVKIMGAELSSIGVESYLSNVGYVPQEPMMMNLSIRENILMGRNFSDNFIESAVSAVALEEKIASLPGGLDYAIGENGQRLSGGERQRLAIARALIASPRILLLDEASSALDEESERSIFSALRERISDTLVVAITHRRAVIGDEDAILNLS